MAIYTYGPYSGRFNYYFTDLSQNDTLNLNAYGFGYNLSVDLRPGGISTLAQGQQLTVPYSSFHLMENVAGGRGNDTIIGNAASNLFNGGDGNDRLYGEGGNDALSGWNGDDLLSGGAGNDFLSGDTGRDTIYGGSGNDVILGGSGQDSLYGGGGIDTFKFADVTTRDSKGIYYTVNDETSVSAPDFIFGFDNPGNLRGDVIDLSSIDAGIGEGNDKLQFGGWLGYNGVNIGPGMIYLGQEGSNTVVYGNIEMGSFNDLQVDFKIVIVDGPVSYTQYNQFDFVV